MYIAGLLAFIASYWLSQKQEEYKLSPSIISYPDYFFREQGLVPRLLSLGTRSRTQTTFSGNKVSFTYYFFWEQGLVPRLLSLGTRSHTHITFSGNKVSYTYYFLWVQGLVRIDLFLTSLSPSSATDSCRIGFLGITRKCVGAWGLISLKATHWERNNQHQH